MALPTTADIWPGRFDPTNYLDFQLDLAGSILETGEWIASYTLTPLAEAVAAGLTISQEAEREPEIIDNTSIKLWLYVDEEMRSDPMFNGDGVLVGIEVTVITNSIPWRREQVTFGIRIAQR